MKFKQLNPSFYILLICIVIVGCIQSGKANQTEKKFQKEKGFTIEGQILAAEENYKLLVNSARQANNIPRTLEDNAIKWINNGFDWTEGFFPGSLWYMYELTNNDKWKKEAIYFQELNFDDRFASSHDLGFVFQCSYGNSFRLTKAKQNKRALIDASNALIDRFSEAVGCIKSWDVDSGWQKQRDWQYPVIIDNMMNLELLFETSLLTGEDKYKNIAISHANMTLKNHFRENNSSYHVVDYDSISGKIRSKQTAQGYAHNSSWARGQAWGLYGFTVSYRYTKNPEYLTQAKKIADYILSNPTISKENIPYWDYNAPNIPNEPKDVSAAAIVASALIELSQYSDKKYLDKAKDIIETLSTDTYFVESGTNGNFLLKHSVGSIPHGAEIDVPLNYADYYYLESLVRLRKL
ncbi:glycoside hydrolase family 88 protein [Flavivirga algicola]|uniref:Glucuronyl hydrolase n=1 Tax=Flavivirga algicola TaxID=2729136 RepID=A0ABX1RXT2_9FLAO|nr:glycoside hydrolase family 88 protein [Flavivirga algicola]NMH88381.1 glucuronyl hydrolase [Flavivirga algicola]